MASKKIVGYDCYFLSKPDDTLRCMICLGVAREPYQHAVCGKLFCKECIESLLTDDCCPNCRRAGAPFYPDIKSELAYLEEIVLGKKKTVATTISPK